MGGQVENEKQPFIPTYQAVCPGSACVNLEEAHLCVLFKGPRFPLHYQQPQAV